MFCNILWCIFEETNKQKQMNILSAKKVDIYGKDYELAFGVKINGNTPSLYAVVNGKSWTLWNLCNYKRNKEESFNDLKTLLMDGSYKMF